MKNQSPDRPEIFLALALDQRARQNSISGNSTSSLAETEDFTLSGNPETALAEEKIEKDFLALLEYLNESEAEKFRRLWTDFQNKTDAEKILWRDQVRAKIGIDEQLIDEQVHHSHINEALEKETVAVQKIIVEFLPSGYKKSVNTFTGKKKKNSHAADLSSASNAENSAVERSALAVKKTVRLAFARQFIALRDLQRPTAFDRLSGTQLARLIRLTGIREVASACVRIEAVESVAAFLRIFSAEDAQSIAAQLNSLSNISDERLAFAEHLVQTALETEPQPSAMLDLLGIWLIGVLLCNNSKGRIRYTNQKLPLEIAMKLPEIIDEQCRQTPADLQKQIGAEIEQLAETLVSRENE